MKLFNARRLFNLISFIIFCNFAIFILSANGKGKPAPPPPKKPVVVPPPKPQPAQNPPNPQPAQTQINQNNNNPLPQQNKNNINVQANNNTVPTPPNNTTANITNPPVNGPTPTPNNNSQQATPQNVTTNTTVTPGKIIPPVQTQPKKPAFNLTAEVHKHYQKKPPAPRPQPRRVNPNVKPVKIDYKEAQRKKLEQLKNQQELKEKKEREEFEKKVEHFDFSDLLTIKLLLKEYDTFEVDIQENTTFYFLFMINHPKHIINFSLKGPKIQPPANSRRRTYADNVILSLKNKNYFFYEYNATKAGKYTFTFLNLYHKEGVKVTYAINIVDPKNAALKVENLDDVSKQILSVENKINELKIRGNLYSKTIDGHKNSVISHNRSIIMYSIIEVVVMTIVFIVQWYYLTKLVEKL